MSRYKEPPKGKQIVTKFKEKQDPDMEDTFDRELQPYWHIIIPPQDYTACGHATDEYRIEQKEGLVDCPNCIELIKFCKTVKIKHSQKG